MIENLPVWRLAPNWKSGVTETLEWLTDVLTSTSGAEQRRVLRRRPRRYFEFDVLVDGPQRSLLDQMLTSHGGRAWWLPVWHDPHVLTQTAAPGSTSLALTGLVDGELNAGDVAVLTDLSGFMFEIIEIDEVTSTTVNLASATTRLWRSGSFVFKAVRSRLVEQPKVTKLSDRVAATVAKFRVDPIAGAFVDAPISDAVDSLTDSYRGYSVLNEAPDESSTLNTDYLRLLIETDNKTAIPAVVDAGERSFAVQRFSWYLRGRSSHAAFRDMVSGLRGRAIPFWLPTFFADFDLVEDIAASDSTITVALCGFTETGGPRPGRSVIRLLLQDGSAVYREIVDSVSGDDFEVLEIDEAFEIDIPMKEIVQISFMDIARLDQDAVEIQHDTDIEGVSRVSVLCRTGTEIRDAGFTGYFKLTNKSGSMVLTNKTGSIELLGGRP